MRIVAGSRKGATIYAPRGLDTRPTSDRVREAAFNLIGPVDDAAVLDVFAGSGAMGLEALSRGARSVVFVEASRDACRAIERNLDKLALTGARVECADAVRALAAEAAANRRYDVMLLDAPYAEWASFEPRLAHYVPALVADDGLVVVETSAREQPSLPLAMRTSRRYGAARLTLFEHATPPGISDLRCSMTNSPRRAST